MEGLLASPVNKNDRDSISDEAGWLVKIMCTFLGTNDSVSSSKNI